MVITRHDRRHSGRRIAKIYHPEKYPDEFEWWDDWTDYRDGQRAPIDRSKIRPTRGIAQWFLDNMHILHDNLKIKIKEKIRRIRKKKQEMKNDLIN
jgi:hypothetical protein